VERLRKEEEKAAKSEQKRVAKQDKRKSKEVPAAQKTVGEEPKVVAGEEPKVEADEEPKVGAGERETRSPTVPRETPAVEEPTETAMAPAHEGFITPIGMRTSMEMQTDERLEEIIKEGEKSPTSPDSSKGVKGWLKTKFTRRQSKPQKPDSKYAGSDKDFVGGAALVGNTNSEPPRTPMNDATVAATSTKDEDIGETADQQVDRSVGETTAEERLGRSKRRASSVSPVSPLEERIELGKETTKDEDFEEARDHFDNDLAPPPTFAVTKPASPVRDSRFHEEM
jgi:hypothetical protein